ncbi:MAG: sodium:calcium antiporter, partial [Alkalibacterium sp.]
MNTYIESLPTLAIIVLFVFALILLSQAADKLIEEAVSLSLILGLSKMVVGATILSVGTTLPEVASSVAATLNGNGQLGLGNAIGSVITNTSLVLGIGAVGGLLPIRKETKKTFLILSLIALLFIGTSIGFGRFPNDGLLPRGFGNLFLIAVPFYIWYTVKKKPEAVLGEIEEVEEESETQGAGEESNLAKRIGLLLLSSLGVTLGATLLVSTAEITAGRLGVPDSVIASTIVAFGTSVPEVSTTLVATRYGHGELAIGNVLGANVMNLLLVMGATITLMPSGQVVPDIYYQLQFPFLLLLFGLLSYPMFSKKLNAVNRKHGFVLLTIYAV